MQIGKWKTPIEMAAYWVIPARSHSSKDEMREMVKRWVVSRDEQRGREGCPLGHRKFYSRENLLWDIGAQGHMSHVCQNPLNVTRQSKLLGKLQTLVNHQFGCFSIVSSAVTNVPHQCKTVIRREMEVRRGTLWELWSFCVFFPWTSNCSKNRSINF